MTEEMTEGLWCAPLAKMLPTGSAIGAKWLGRLLDSIDDPPAPAVSAEASRTSC